MIWGSKKGGGEGPKPPEKAKPKEAPAPKKGPEAPPKPTDDPRQKMKPERAPKLKQKKSPQNMLVDMTKATAMDVNGEPKKLFKAPFHEMSRGAVRGMFKVGNAGEYVNQLIGKDGFAKEVLGELKKLAEKTTEAGKGGLIGTSSRKKLAEMVAGTLTERLSASNMAKMNAEQIKDIVQLAVWADSNLLILVDPKSRMAPHGAKREIKPPEGKELNAAQKKALADDQAKRTEREKTFTNEFRPAYDAYSVDLIGRDLDQAARFVKSSVDRAELKKQIADKRKADKKADTKGLEDALRKIKEVRYPDNGLLAYLAHELKVQTLQPNAIKKTLADFKYVAWGEKSAKAKKETVKGAKRLENLKIRTKNKREYKERLELAKHVDKIEEHLALVKARAEKLQLMVSRMGEELKKKPFKNVGVLLLVMQGYLKLAQKFAGPGKKENLLQKLRLKAKDYKPLPEEHELSQLAGMYGTAQGQWIGLQEGVNRIASYMPLEQQAVYGGSVSLDTIPAANILSFLGQAIVASRNSPEAESKVRMKKLDNQQEQEQFLRKVQTILMNTVLPQFQATLAKLEADPKTTKNAMEKQRAKVASVRDRAKNIGEILDPRSTVTPENREKRRRKYVAQATKEGFE